MSTFYLVPPRPFLGEHFSRYLSALFPGLDWPSQAWGELADFMAAAPSLCRDVYIVFREELPIGEDVERALRDAYGAEDGDEVIEVAVAKGKESLPVKRWQLTRAA